MHTIIIVNFFKVHTITIVNLFNVHTIIVVNWFNMHSCTRSDYADAASTQFKILTFLWKAGYGNQAFADNLCRIPC